MKSPIGWHKDCLKNMIAHSEREARSLELSKSALDKLLGRIELYRGQIERAEKECRAGFDEERYGVKGQ